MCTGPNCFPLRPFMPSRRSFTVARSGWMRWGAATLLTQRIFVAAQIVSVVVVLLAIAEHSQSVHCPEKCAHTTAFGMNGSVFMMSLGIPSPRHKRNTVPAPVRTTLQPVRHHALYLHFLVTTTRGCTNVSPRHLIPGEGSSWISAPG